MNVITSERSMRWRRSTVMPYAVMMYLISEAIMDRAASMPSTLCISMMWFDFVSRPSTPGLEKVASEACEAMCEAR